MHIEAEHDAVVLKLGRRFTPHDADRLREAIEALAPFSQLTVDFTEVRELHDAAFLSLSQALAALVHVKVVLRGLTLHQVRVLKYLGVPPSEVVA
jgi:STAS domain